ncbi:uroporphyrinogen decarboxylase family protein [Desulfomonile tiedjei]|uniref:Uroporphyrinogen-III decarboxylase n=1 Tax=Desulfomonile tiedjei (strain ATCC 49306 / DSM 6799 / DCB-1) TaxID=706587 RepID=I4C6X1_DESTA|nr:uroporphyrinogen decarboxylase family protein [Desulfomonile tiedjei]AFM25312.1 uroporphyrinogen-III decarboxylase [Desulfomonile tiedjei DSM 6799]
MNSIERIKAAVNFQPPDRVPVIGQVFGHAAVLAGVPVGEYVRSGELLARCQIQALKRYDYDAVFALMDASVETEAAGSVLTYRADQYPIVRTYALSDGTDLERLSVPDPRRAGRMPDLLKALGIMRQEVGDDVLVVGCVVGPMTVATQLLGIEAALYLAVDEPERFSRLLDYATEVALQFGISQIEAGAHLPLVFDPSSSEAVIPYQFFRDMVLPRLQRVFQTFKQAGAVANWLHIAGPTHGILPFYPQAGVDIANIDCEVNLLDARSALPQTCLDGNIKCLDFVQANPDAIAAESSRLIGLFADRRGFILSSGCEIPLESRPENIAAMVAATRERR